MAKKQLVPEIDSLLQGISECAEHRKAEIDRVAPTHAEGARNLVHYKYLRSQDLRRLQAHLSDLGVTRMSTIEVGVKAKLEAARNVVGMLEGSGAPYDFQTIADSFARADEILEEHTERLLGPTDENTPSRIMVTLPTEAAEDFDMVASFVDSGMDIARINCAHDGPEVWQRMIANVHRAGAAAGREVRVNMDLAGPKIRTGEIAPGPAVGRARVTRDDAGKVLCKSKLWLTAVGEDGPEAPEFEGRPALPVQVAKEWLEGLQVDSIISLHDSRGSKREFQVVEKREGAVLAEGDRNAYIAEGTLLECDYERARAHGIPHVVQALRMHVGDKLALTSEDVVCEIAPGKISTISCSLPEAVAALEVGHNVLFDDGSIAAVVVERRQSPNGGQEAVLEITRAKEGGVKLAAHKGINLPDTQLSLPSITAEDEEHLEFVARHGDIAAISFIRSVADVHYLWKVMDRLANKFDEESPELGERVRQLGVVLKIETVPAFENISEILLEGMRHPNFGIMIARGDLAVELGFDRMTEVPGQLMVIAEAAHIPVIVGTQILENMAKNGLPSRAEMTDAAFALRAESVMLNKGPHITDAIEILNKLSRRLGRSQRKNRMLLRHIHSWDD
ncbi:pyruvate kinase [Corynebacterium sp. H127]|uniref:pyruvate kinase n=1 Tax=Corynebacterium sp. H127 TaxID=3133418 RepID=UPI0030A2DFE8